MVVNLHDCGLAPPILDWFRQHAIVHTAEPSFKLSQAGLSAQRGLFGFSKARLGDLADPMLFEFCLQLGMPSELLQHYQQALVQTGYVGFGYECDGDVKRYKAYLDFSAHASAGIRILGSNDSKLQFLGYKWVNAGANEGKTRAVITEYRAFPLLSRRGMRRRSLECLGQLNAGKNVIETAFSICARDWPDRPLEYMEAREAGNARVSFDIKFYSTSFCLASLLPELQFLGDQLGLGPDLNTLLQANANSRLGHLAGGLDRSGIPFLMVYHGVKRRITPEPV